MNIALWSKKDFQTNDGWVKPEFSKFLYENFHYFKGQHIHDTVFNESFFFQTEYFFIIAYEGELCIENVVGVLKYGFYEDHVGINYVDIRNDKKHQGIGTKLLQYFNNLHFDQRVHCSYFSDECLKTNFHKTCFKILTNHDILWDHHGYTFKNDPNFYDIDETTIIPNPWL